MTTAHRSVGFILVLAFLVPLAALIPACKTPSAEEIKAALEIVDVETKWVMKEYRQWPNPKLVVVPVIMFKVRNKSNRPLTYINFNAIFKEKEGKENVGDNFLAAIRNTPIQPGEASPVITLKSNFGVEGKNLEDIKTNPFWKPWIVKLFAVKSAHHILMGEWDMSRVIDFKEDTAVPPAETQKAEPVKK